MEERENPFLQLACSHELLFLLPSRQRRSRSPVVASSWEGGKEKHFRKVPTSFFASLFWSQFRFFTGLTTYLFPYRRDPL